MQSKREQGAKYSKGSPRSARQRRQQDSSMSGLLTEMAQSSLARLEQARALESEQELWGRVCTAPTAPRLKLSPEGFDIIAECKLASPSAGDLSQHTTDIDRRIQAYA